MSSQARGERRREAIMDFIVRIERIPTVREVAKEVDCGVATAHRHLRILREQGQIGKANS